MVNGIKYYFFDKLNYSQNNLNNLVTKVKVYTYYIINN